MEDITKNVTIKTDLKKLYTYFNNMYFEGALVEDIPVEYSNKLSKMLGLCYYRYNEDYDWVEAKRICLNKKYFTLYEDEIIPVLLHEMIHAENPEEGHNVIFMRRMESLSLISGFEIRRRGKRSLPKTWLQTCTDCKNTHKSHNRAKKTYVCGKCKGKLIETKIIYN